MFRSPSFFLNTEKPEASCSSTVADSTRMTPDIDSRIKDFCLIKTWTRHTQLRAAIRLAKTPENLISLLESCEQMILRLERTDSKGIITKELIANIQYLMACCQFSIDVQENRGEFRDEPSALTFLQKAIDDGHIDEHRALDIMKGFYNEKFRAVFISAQKKLQVPGQLFGQTASQYTRDYPALAKSLLKSALNLASDYEEDRFESPRDKSPTVCETSYSYGSRSRSSTM